MAFCHSCQGLGKQWPHLQGRSRRNEKVKKRVSRRHASRCLASWLRKSHIGWNSHPNDPDLPVTSTTRRQNPCKEKGIRTEEGEWLRNEIPSRSGSNPVPFPSGYGLSSFTSPNPMLSHPLNSNVLCPRQYFTHFVYVQGGLYVGMEIFSRLHPLNAD